MVDGRRHTHTTTHGFPLDPSDDKLGARSDGVDDQGKAAEKCQAFFLVGNGHEFIKAGSSAERTVAGRLQHDHFDVLPLSRFRHAMVGQLLEDGCGKAVGGWVEERDGSHPAVVDLGPDKGVHGSAAVVQRHKVPLCRTGVHLTWSANRFAILGHFFPLADPSWQAAKGEHHGEHVSGDA